IDTENVSARSHTLCRRNCRCSTSTAHIEHSGTERQSKPLRRCAPEEVPKGVGWVVVRIRRRVIGRDRLRIRVVFCRHDCSGSLAPAPSHCPAPAKVSKAFNSNTRRIGPNLPEIELALATCVSKAASTYRK